jgi:glycosyltransferase involved in cell wall biosynthesis
MRILLVSDRMSNPGGAERYIEFLRDGLRMRGDEAILISCGARVGKPTGADYEAFSSDSVPLKAFLQIANPAAASRIRSVVRSFRPDVALVSQFAYHLSPSAIGALGDVPTVLSMMDYKAICPLGTRTLPNGSACVERAGVACRRNECIGLLHWLRDQPRYSRIRSEMKRVRRVICPSEWMVREFSASGIDAEQISFGVPEPSESFAYRPAQHPRFVYCGRLSPEKGVPLLLRAFSKFNGDVPHATLTLVGDGPMREEIERQILTLGLSRSVSITGWLSAAQVDVELSTAWAVVTPSLWAEPFGIAAIEAIMRGIPVVASDSGGFAENIENDVTGLLFTPRDESSLVQSLRRVAARAVFRAGRIEAGAVERSRARFSLDAHVERMRNVFLEMM